MTENSHIPSLSIILPTYNERENIAIFIPRLEKQFSNIPHEIIVVDDSSPDGTGELVLQLAEKIPGLRLITREKKIGIGAALREGYNNAANDIILSSDADLSFSPGDLMRIYEKIGGGGYDIVIGSLHGTSQGADRKANNLGTTLKRLVSIISNGLLRTIFCIPLSSFSVNCRAIRHDTWRLLHTKDNGNFFLFEMLFLAHKANAHIGEIPVMYVDREYGYSKVNRIYVREAIKALGKIIRFRLRR